jgi:putative transposase
MRMTGLHAIYPKRRINTSSSHLLRQKYPYLLRTVDITRPNHVWGTDITYIRLQSGFAYLVAIIDWFSRYVLAFELSDSLETEFCMTALNRALQAATPEIHNSDQGTQFTDERYTTILTSRNVQISMDGRGRCMDNIFTERLWRSVKYEDVYLKSYQTIHEAREGLSDYFTFYNTTRKHQSLNYRTPKDVYFNNQS